MISVEKTAEKILTYAVKFSASDVHIFPRKDDPMIQFRVENRLIPLEFLKISHLDKLISHFKFLASMDIGEKRRPQTGSFTHYYNGQAIGLRLSTLPALNSESLVIRLIPQQNILPLTQLSLFPRTAKKLMALMQHSHGLIIFTGPTGSGKTTTLYSLLHYAKEHIQRNIITLEDPIENQTEDAVQVQINEKAGITYSVGLKAALRHDPDIIMIGEIRDAETAKIAVRAALTGHLILTTMHTRDAEGAIYRLLEFGVSKLEIEQTLIAVTAQRLVELYCPLCGEHCSHYCSFNNRGKRAGIYELLHGKSLAKLLTRSEVERPVNWKRLKDEMNKAVALGFVPPDEYDRWIYNNENS